ncbi:hypothetical protein ACIRJO_41245 [Streptomyces sp. NPDC102394]|uniref:hypothetical protein n=1 Tax=Streptomyces sp. NPDC102394 TaxID=3366167 RepID=UPI003814726A
MDRYARPPVAFGLSGSGHDRLDGIGATRRIGADDRDRAVIINGFDLGEYAYDGLAPRSRRLRSDRRPPCLLWLAASLEAMTACGSFGP